MRKTLLVLMTLTTLVGFSACSDDDDYLAPTSHSFVFSIEPSEWKSNDGGKVWYVDLDVPEITQYYYDQGGVDVHLGRVDDVYEPIPATLDGVAYRFDYRIGLMTIDIQWADAANQVAPKPTNTIWVKVILTDTDSIQ
ncbi:hypothetical protein SAMN05216436_12085 [bacterium A37T11]|nr:hypothetical protein SAMN05216436_12085 [bacterium A37T11]